MHSTSTCCPPLALLVLTASVGGAATVCRALGDPAQSGEFKAGSAPRPPAALIQQLPATRCAAGRPGCAGDALVRCRQRLSSV